MKELASRLAMQHLINAYSQETGSRILLEKYQQNSTQLAFSQGLTLLMIPLESIQSQLYVPLSYRSLVGRHRIDKLPQIFNKGQAQRFSPIAISKWLNWSLTQLLMVGLSSMLIGLILSIYTQQIVIFQLAYVFYGIAVACLMPAFTTGASQSVSINLQTKIAALCTMAQALSLVVAPLMSTGLYQLNIIFPYYLLLSIFLLLSFYFVVFKWNK